MQVICLIRAVCKIYKALLQLNNKRTSTQFKKQTNKKTDEALNRHFPREANKHMKKCATPLVIRKMLIKTTTRCPLIPSRMAVLKPEHKCGQGLEEMETLTPCWWECKWLSPCGGKQCGGFSKS